MKRLFLLLALAMPFFLYGEEPSIFTPTLSADAPVSDDTVATTDSAGGTDLIVRPDTPENLTVAADTLPKDILEVYLAHLTNKEQLHRTPRKASSSTPHLDSTIVIKNGEIYQKIIYTPDAYGRDFRITTYGYTNGIPNGTSTITEYVYEGSSITAARLLTSNFQYNGTNWIGKTRTEYIFDDYKNIITTITYQWNTTYQFWTPTNSTIYKPKKVKNTYYTAEESSYSISADNKLAPISLHKKDWDAAGNLILDEYYRGGMTNGVWQHKAGDTKKMYTYTQYTNNKQQKTLEESYTWDSSIGWKGSNGNKMTWAYSSDGLIQLERISYSWDQTNKVYYPAIGEFNEYLIINGVENKNYPTIVETCTWTAAGVKTGTKLNRTFYTGTHADSLIVYTWSKPISDWKPSKVTIYAPNSSATEEVVQWAYNTQGSITASSKRTIYNSDTTIVNGITTITKNIVQKWDITTNDWEESTKQISHQGPNWTATVNYKYSNGNWVVVQKNSSKVYSSNTTGEIVNITYLPEDGATDTIWTISQGTRITNLSTAGTVIHLEYQTQVGISAPIWLITSGTKTVDSSVAGTTIHLEYISQTGISEPIWIIKNGSKSVVTSTAGKETTTLNYLATTEVEDPVVWIPNGGSKIVNISEGDTIGTITYTYSSSNTTVVGTKSLNTTDALGASIYLKWELTLTSTDSIWTITEGRRKPLNETDSHGKTTRVSEYYWNVSENKWKLTSAYITIYDYQNSEEGELVQEVQLGQDSAVLTETTRMYNEHHKPTIIVSYSNGTPAYRQEYTYAADGTTIKNDIHYIGWENACNSWHGISNITTLYHDIFTDKQVALIQYLWSNCEWVLWSESYTYYDQNGKDTLILNKSYGINDTKIEKSYSGNTLTKNDTYKWINDEWKLTGKEEHNTDGSSIKETYTNTGVITSQTLTSPSGEITETRYSNGVPTSQTQTTYLNGNPTYEETKLIVTAFNPDGSPATYTLTTNYYNTEE